MRGEVTRHHHHPCSVLVEAVYDARARQLLQALIDGQQPIDQRTVKMPGGRMHDQAGGLVDHEYILVPMQNIELDVLRLVGYDGLFGYVEIDQVAAEYLLPGFTGLLIDTDEPLLYPLLYPTA